MPLPPDSRGAAVTDPATTRLTEIEQRLAAATPGPWTIHGEEEDDDRIEGMKLGADDLIETDGGYYGPRLANATFIAHAPDDVRWLIQHTRALEAVAEAARNLHTEINRDPPIVGLRNSTLGPLHHALTKALAELDNPQDT